LGIQLVRAVLGHGEWEVFDWVALLLPSTLLIARSQHGLLRVIAFHATDGVVECSLDACWGMSIELLTSGTTVRVASSLCVEPHLHNEEKEK
jgi:hypothetical protein